jgi:hypothetical protein
MIMNMKSLGKMREIIDTCYKGQEDSVVEFWKHKVVDSTAVRDFYILIAEGGHPGGHGTPDDADQ